MADEGAGDPPVPTDGDELDTYVRLLAAAERRHAIRVLRTVETPIATADLAREIAAREPTPGGEGDQLDAAEHLRTALNHVHLPKLAAADVVELADDRNTIAPGANFEPVAGLLDAIEEASGQG